MELTELIRESHGIREKIKSLTVQIDKHTIKLEELDTEIKQRLNLKDKEIEELSEEEFQLLMSDISDPVKITVEVVYLNKDVQHLCEVQLSRGSTIEDSIKLSNILDKANDIDLAINKVGVFGMVKPLSEILTDGDRVEIYRPITAKA